MTNNPGLFSVCEKTVYRYIAGGLLTTKNGDLPRKMSLKPRKGKSVEHKVDSRCRLGRTYADYTRFLAENPGLPVTEMDTVEGVKGGKVLLTLHFMPYDFMLAFLLERNAPRPSRKSSRTSGGVWPRRTAKRKGGASSNASSPSS